MIHTMDYIDEAIQTTYTYPGPTIPYENWRRLVKHMLRWKAREA